MTVGLIRYEPNSFDLSMDLKQMNGPSNHNLNAQPNFAAEGQYIIDL